MRASPDARGSRQCRRKSWRNSPRVSSPRPPFWGAATAGCRRRSCSMPDSGGSSPKPLSCPGPLRCVRSWSPSRPGGAASTHGATPGPSQKSAAGHDGRAAQGRTETLPAERSEEPALPVTGICVRGTSRSSCQVLSVNRVVPALAHSSRVRSTSFVAPRTWRLVRTRRGTRDGGESSLRPLSRMG